MQGTILSGRYQVADEIGIGGMGNVYRAMDLRTGAVVAVKIPHAFLARNPEYVERLRREAQIAASLNSPRIVRVLDLDMHEDLPYLVMEFVPGDTLADLLRSRGRFGLEDTLTLGVEVARALDAAHAQGIVHRDLKPQNIKFVDGEVKVLDFGIAKAEGFGGITSLSIFMGTPEYCAPERGDGLGDIRSDIYSLGVMLFEMHEGFLPFQGLTPIAVMRKHEHEPPPPLSGDVPEAVQSVVSHCLAKRPEDRYQTPHALVRDLLSVMRLLPDSAGRPTPRGSPLVAPARPTVLPGGDVRVAPPQTAATIALPRGGASQTGPARVLGGRRFRVAARARRGPRRRLATGRVCPRPCPCRDPETTPAQNPCRAVRLPGSGLVEGSRRRLWRWGRSLRCVRSSATAPRRARRLSPPHSRRPSPHP